MINKTITLIILLILLVLALYSNALVLNHKLSLTKISHRPYTNLLHAASISLDSDSSRQTKKEIDYTSPTNPYYEELSKPIKYGAHLNIKGRVLNFWGIVYALTTFVVAVACLPFMIIGTGLIKLFGNIKQRKALDWIVHIWASLVFKLTLSFPKVYGLENLPPSSETVMYVPNHTSFVDILLFSGFVPRPFKYLSKAEILKIPVIGLAMKLAMHVFLARGDLRSTLEATEQTTQRLHDGNSMVLFAEGTRSSDGKLQQFKKGAFQIAKAAGVRIVPVSIGNLFRLMPKQAILPIAPLRHAYIKIHPVVETANRTISEIRAETHAAVNSGLPPYQQYVKPERGAVAATAAAGEE